MSQYNINKYSKYPKLNTLRKLRIKNKVKQADIAYFIGVTTQYYSQMERGINLLSYKHALQIAAYFDKSPDELFQADFLNFSGDKDLKKLNHLKKTSN